MNIHPSWFICILVRISLIFVIKYIYENKKNKIRITYLLLIIIGFGFIYKGYSGSNNEKQISNVFWHDSRYIHGILYLSSCYYLINNKINITLTILLVDIIFSILYRVINNK